MMKTKNEFQDTIRSMTDTLGNVVGVPVPLSKQLQPFDGVLAAMVRDLETEQAKVYDYLITRRFEIYNK